jgi:hypothetical protein
LQAGARELFGEACLNYQVGEGCGVLLGQLKNELTWFIGAHSDLFNDYSSEVGERLVMARTMKHVNLVACLRRVRNTSIILMILFAFPVKGVSFEVIDILSQPFLFVFGYKKDDDITAFWGDDPTGDGMERFVTP